MTDETEPIQVSVILDDPELEGYVVKNLATGDEDEIETFLQKGQNGSENWRFQEALRAVREAWEREIEPASDTS